MHSNDRWLGALAALTTLAGCAGEDTSSAAPASAISDQARGGARGFYWLPPIGRAPATTGAFAPNARPTLVIDDTTANARVASYTTTSGPSCAPIRVSLADESYTVQWRTRDFRLNPAHNYRLRVFVPDSAACAPPATRVPGLGCEVGYADVDVVASGSQLHTVDETRYIALLPGRVLNVKFRIETTAVDADGDGRYDALDNCPTRANPGQADSVGNGVGDACAASDVCHVAGVCSPTTGACSNPSAPDGAVCSLPQATAACAGGACAVAACAAGRGDCDGAAANGCEADLASAASCGACGNACAAGSVCTAGACVVPCAAGTTACGGACVSLAVDRANCGACGSACGAGQVCVEGACGSAWARALGWAGGVASVARDPRTGVIYVASRFIAGADLGGVTLTPSGSTDVALAAYAASGAFLWHRQVRTASSDNGVNVALDATGNVYMAGSSTSGGAFDGGPSFEAAAGSDTTWVVGYTADGAYRWHRVLSGRLRSQSGPMPHQLAASRDHVVLLPYLNAGTHDLGGGPLAGNAEALVRYAAVDGAFVSAVSEAGWEPRALALDGAGHAYLAGSMTAGGGIYAPRLRARDAAGLEVWTRSDPAPAGAYGALAVAPNGDNYVVAFGNSAEDPRAIHARDASGATRWIRTGLVGVHPYDAALDGTNALYLAVDASHTSSVGGPVTTGGPNEGMVVGYAATDGAFRFQRRNFAYASSAGGVVPLGGSLLIVTGNPGNVGTVIGYGYASSTVASTGQQHALHLQPAD
jgi:hypothetical protein